VPAEWSEGELRAAPKRCTHARAAHRRVEPCRPAARRSVWRMRWLPDPCQAQRCPNEPLAALPSPPAATLQPATLARSRETPSRTRRTWRATMPTRGGRRARPCEDYPPFHLLCSSPRAAKAAALPDTGSRGDGCAQGRRNFGIAPKDQTRSLSLLRLLLYRLSSTRASWPPCCLSSAR